MSLKLSYKNIEEFDKEYLSKITLANDGDGYERVFWPYINERFPNYEKFWQKHIVLLTKRIETATGTDRIKPRDTVDTKLLDISEVHYSIFMNLIQAYNRLEHPDLSWFEDFYVHLVSACDLAEMFCKRIERLRIVNINLQNTDAYNNYHKFVKLINDYRNQIVHNTKIGKNHIISQVVVGNNIQTVITVLVPRKEEIKKYDTWRKVASALKDINILKNDFIEIKDQMISDIREIETLFNNLWSVILEKMEPLRNHKEYLKLQDIEFSDGEAVPRPIIPPDNPPAYDYYLGSGIGSSVSLTSHPVSAMTEKDIIKKKSR